jgi:hypothetical protein
MEQKDENLDFAQKLFFLHRNLCKIWKSKSKDILGKSAQDMSDLHHIIN